MGKFIFGQIHIFIVFSFSNSAIILHRLDSLFFSSIFLVFPPQTIPPIFHTPFNPVHHIRNRSSSILFHPRIGTGGILERFNNIAESYFIRSIGRFSSFLNIPSSIRRLAFHVVTRPPGVSNTRFPCMKSDSHHKRMLRKFMIHSTGSHGHETLIPGQVIREISIGIQSEFHFVGIWDFLDLLVVIRLEIEHFRGVFVVVSHFFSSVHVISLSVGHRHYDDHSVVHEVIHPWVIFIISI